MGMGFASTWLRQVSPPPPPASHDNFKHYIQRWNVIIVWCWEQRRTLE